MTFSPPIASLSASCLRVGCSDPGLAFFLRPTCILIRHPAARNLLWPRLVGVAKVTEFAA
jgi:hypothetical protein